MLCRISSYFFIRHFYFITNFIKNRSSILVGIITINCFVSKKTTVFGNRKVLMLQKSIKLVYATFRGIIHEINKKVNHRFYRITVLNHINDSLSKYIVNDSTIVDKIITINYNLPIRKFLVSIFNIKKIVNVEEIFLKQCFLDFIEIRMGFANNGRTVFTN